MRTLRRNQQKMFYSIYKESQPVYDRDSQGNIKKVVVDGVEVPIEIGTLDNTYDAPVEFWASITSKLNTLHARAYGVDQSSIHSELVVQKGTLPKDFKYGTKVWKDTEISYKADGTPDESTADYTVTGLMMEMLNFDFYLLQRNNNG